MRERRFARAWLQGVTAASGHWGWRLGFVGAAAATLLAGTSPAPEAASARELPVTVPRAALAQIAAVTYVVEPGDTLSDIALATGRSLSQLVDLNDIADPDQIRVGQALRLGSAGPSAAARPSVTTGPLGGYVVAPGDTLSEIAARFGVPLSSLVAWNGLADPDHIVVGVSLKVTGTAAASPPQRVVAAAIAAGGAEWMGSPNYWPGRPSGQPIALVIHTMAGSLEGARGEFANPFSNASAHYGVGLRGTIHQYVMLGDRAWANGGLELGHLWPGPSWLSPNELTVSIETEDLGDPGQPVTDAQFQATLQMSRHILARFPSIQYLMTHRAIAPQSRANDPGDRWVAKGRLQALANALGLKAIP